MDKTVTVMVAVAMVISGINAAVLFTVTLDDSGIEHVTVTLDLEGLLPADTVSTPEVDTETQDTDYRDTDRDTESPRRNNPTRPQRIPKLYTDYIYRLTQIHYPDQSTVDFTYDLNSNRTKMEDDAPNANDYIEYTYDSWNRLTSETRHILTSTCTVSYQYDEANNMTKLTYPNSMEILYSYDDFNRTTEIKRYVDGSNDEILMDNVQYDTESLLTQFDYGNDLQATFTYDTRDRPLTIVGESALAGSEDHYLFNGKQKDPTGLYYYGARYYDPVLGRFLTRDTERRNYKISQGLNRYSYCRNNPLSYVDPDGRMEKKITIDGARSSHPYRVFGITPPHNVFGVLLLSIPVTSKEGLVRVEGSFIKYYAPQNVTSAESSSIWAPSSVNVSVIALEIKCNEEMLETEISLTTEGEFELVGYEETESGQILKVSVKIYPKSDGQVVIEFSFEVWALGEEVEIRITLYPTTASLIPISEDLDTEFREEWEITVPAGDGPAAI